MTATDVLRRLLDENDEYYKTSGNKTWWGRPIDRQTGKPINVFHYQAQPMGEDRLLVELQLATPEQAIAATLGSCNCSNNCTDDCTNSERTGTCHDEGDPGDFCCSACGVRMFTNTSDTYTMIASDGRTIIKRPNYCPNCGAKVVEPTTNDVDAEVTE